MLRSLILQSLLFASLPDGRLFDTVPSPPDETEEEKMRRLEELDRLELEAIDLRRECIRRERILREETEARRTRSLREPCVEDASGEHAVDVSCTRRERTCLRCGGIEALPPLKESRQVMRARKREENDRANKIGRR